MKFFLDANMNRNLAEPLNNLFLEHEFTTAFDLGLQNEGDTALFPKVAQLGFEYFVTHDSNQLRRLDERRGLWEAGLHWVGVQNQPRPGLAGLALTMAALTAGIPFVLGEAPEKPTCYHLKGISAEPGQRFRSSHLALADWEE